MNSNDPLNDPDVGEPGSGVPRSIDPLREPLLPARANPRSLGWRISIGSMGAVLLAGGIVLGPVPVVPGFPLVVVGLLMLATSSESARNLINRLETRLPLGTRRMLRRILRGTMAKGEPPAVVPEVAQVESGDVEQRTAAEASASAGAARDRRCGEPG